MTKNLLFLGMEFHGKTGSADFLLQMLKEHYEVSICLINNIKNKGSYECLEKFRGDYDVVLCWQVMPPRKYIEKYFTYRNAAFFPMADSCPNVKKFEKWYDYRYFNIICFSKTVHSRLVNKGLCSHYIQFFPEPICDVTPGDMESAFFWARREQINCDLVERLLSGSGVKRVHVHNAPDPGMNFRPPSASSVFTYSYTHWFPQKSAMLREIESSAYYIAPRQKEGIGMSFLEAMSMGRCVVAPDCETMNEYISHGKTGLLYDINDPRPLHRHDVRMIQKNVRNYMKEGYAKWESSKDMVVDWLERPVTINSSKMVKPMVKRFFSNPFKTLTAFRY